MILGLGSKKKTGDSIPVHILKITADVCSPFLTKLINDMFESCTFPTELKYADVVPVFKKGDFMDIRNYRPISLLSSISKVFEIVMFEQLSRFFERIFSPLLCGFRKGYNTQYALLRLPQRWQQNLDQSRIVGTIL